MKLFNASFTMSGIEGYGRVKLNYYYPHKHKRKLYNNVFEVSTSELERVEFRELKLILIKRGVI